MRTKYIVLVAAFLAVLAAAATALAIANGIKPAPKTPVPVAYTPVRRLAAAPTPPTVALQQVLARMQGDAVASARIGTAPPAAERADLPWLYATVRVPAMQQGLDVEPLWEADLVEGAVADSAGTSANIRSDFGGSTFDAVLPDGSKISDAGGGLGDVVRGQAFSAASSGAVQSSIVRLLHNAGLTPRSVKVLRPDGPAPAVVASTTDVASAARNFVQHVKTLFGSPPVYEGYYLELRDADGNAFVRASASFRTGAGRFWVDPRWANLVGEKTLGSTGRVAGSG
jgi:hypothetical protein